MKTGLRVIFLMIFGAMLACEVAYAVTVGDATKPQEARASSQSEGHDRAPKENHPHSLANPAKPGHLALPHSQKRSAGGKVADAPKPSFSRAAGPVNGVPSTKKGASKTRPVQPQITSRPFIPASTNLRHRNPNLASVGGSTSSRAPNTAAINGTHVGRHR
jgi:hypothetical protein